MVRCVAQRAHRGNSRGEPAGAGRRAHRRDEDRGFGVARAASRGSRQLVLAVRQQEAGAAFVVTLPPSDRAVVAVRAGRIGVPAFVDEVFGAPQFDHKPIAGFFTGARPQFYATSDGVSVSAASGFQRVGLGDLPAFAGDLEITNAFTGPTVRVAGGAQADRPADSRQW